MQAWLAITQLIDLGGPVMPALMCICLMLWTLIIERYWFLYQDSTKLKSQLITQYQIDIKHCQTAQKSLADLLLSEAKSQLDKHQDSIRLLIKLCPLFGLLGTVSGMISVFDVIASTGNDDIKAMAAGIYRATLPTMAGLMLALSALYFSHQLRQKSEQILGQLTTLFATRQNLS